VYQSDKYRCINIRQGTKIFCTHWHETIANATLADAILDRLMHNAYTIELKVGLAKNKTPKAFNIKIRITIMTQKISFEEWMNSVFLEETPLVVELSLKTIEYVKKSF